MVSATQRMQELNETRAQALTEREWERTLREAAAWRSDPERWRLPVPEQEADPANPQTHPSPLGAISWLFPRTEDLTVFFSLMDRLWSVKQADEAPDRMLVERVDPDPRVGAGLRVTWSEPDHVWGAKLLGMMRQVSAELGERTREPTEESDMVPDPVELVRARQMIDRFSVQVQRVRETSQQMGI